MRNVVAFAVLACAVATAQPQDQGLEQTRRQLIELQRSMQQVHQSAPETVSVPEPRHQAALTTPDLPPVEPGFKLALAKKRSGASYATTVKAERLNTVEGRPTEVYWFPPPTNQSDNCPAVPEAAQQHLGP